MPSRLLQADQTLFRLPLNALALLTFVSGFCELFYLDSFGQIYITELILVPTAVLALLTRKGQRAFESRVFWAMIITIVLMLCGYILSDFIRETEPKQYLRGWGRVLFVLSDSVCLMIIAASDKRNFWWYCLGAALGGLFYQIVIAYSTLESWKVTYAVPVALLILCMGHFGGKWVLPGLLVLASLVGLLLDSRADPAILMMIAILLWIRRKDQDGRAKIKLQIGKYFLPFVIGIFVFSLAYFYTSDKFDGRRNISGVGRSLSLTLGVQAITESPWIGAGSWNDYPGISRLHDEMLKERLDKNTAAASSGRGFSPHSQILQGWYEGGVLAGIFFIALAYLAFKFLPFLILRRPIDRLSGILLYIVFSGIWHLFMSPFRGEHRLDIALLIAAAWVLSEEKKRQAVIGHIFRNRYSLKQSNQFFKVTNWKDQSHKKQN